MAQIFVWRPKGLSRIEADERFHAVLGAQRRVYDATFGRTYDLRRYRVGAVQVAQISTDDGLRGWSSWAQEKTRGIAWSGVCEEFLARPMDAVDVDRAVRTFGTSPASMADWRGSWSGVAWDDDLEQAWLATGAAQSQTLWWTEGPHGWAAGSRARPLLELVGREPSLDATQATVFLSFGYLAGDGHLFAGVRRLPSRSRVSLSDDSRVEPERYVSVADLIAGAGRSTDEDRAVEELAERLASRVALQARHSSRPELSLTGGRDSRCIAAALARSGIRVPTHTHGTSDSTDVVLARRVAGELGMPHQSNASTSDAIHRLAHSYDRALRWSRLSEGIETLRHGLHFGAFFEEDEPYSGEPHQKFNGLHALLKDRTSPRNQRDAIENRVRKEFLHAADARHQVGETADRLLNAVEAAGGGPHHWAELWYWQVRVLHFGQDNLLTKDPFTWWWTPLADLDLIRAHWRLPVGDRRPSYLIERVTHELAPKLREIPYDKDRTRPGLVHRLLRRVQRKAVQRFGSDGNSGEPLVDRRRVWESLLFERPAPAWPDLVSEDVVRDALESSGGSNLLWRIATLELFVESHCAPEWYASTSKEVLAAAHAT